MLGDCIGIQVPRIKGILGPMSFNFRTVLLGSAVTFLEILRRLGLGFRVGIMRRLKGPP